MVLQAAEVQTLWLVGQGLFGFLFLWIGTGSNPVGL